MAEVEIGLGKLGRRAYSLDEVAIVPSRRTRDPEDVDLSWEIDAFHFDLPVMASDMDGGVSPASALSPGWLGGGARGPGRRFAGRGMLGTARCGIPPQR